MLSNTPWSAKNKCVTTVNWKNFASIFFVKICVKIFLQFMATHNNQKHKVYIVHG